MDAFYVSVELQRRPELRGLPVVVAGSGPRAVVTTASYEARKFGIFSATPAERARRLCPDATFVPPDFEHYRARSRDVMAVLRSQVERVEVVGLDEAYLDLTGLDRYRSAARRVKEAVRTRDRPHLLGRARAEQAGGEGGVGRREAGRVRGAERRRGARALRRGLPRPRARHRAQDGGPARAARDPDAGAARRHARTSSSRSGSAPASGPHLAALARFEDERLHRDRAGGEVRVARDHLRPRPARPPPARAGARAPHRRALRDARPRGAARPHDRDQGPLRRLHDRHARPQPRRGGERRRTRSERSRSSFSGASIRPRPVRLLGVRVAGLDEESAQAVADDQLSLSL